jgi:hypothetical protein
LFYLDKDSKKD